MTNLNEIHHNITVYRNRFIHGRIDSDDLINSKTLFEYIKILFPKANTNAFNNQNKFEVVSLIDLIWIKPETFTWLNDLLTDKEYKRILLLDETASPLWGYLGKLETKLITFVSDNLKGREYFKILFPDSEILTKEELDKSDIKFNLVLANIPFGGGLSNREIITFSSNSDENRTIEVGKSVAFLARGLQHLEKSGIQFTISNNTRLLFKDGLKDVLKFDFQIKGIFQPTDYTFFANTPLLPEFLYFNHGSSTDVFVGKIGETPEQQNLLFKNFKKNNNTNIVSTGKVIQLEKFVSVKNLESKEKYEIAAKHAGGILKPISELVIQNGWVRLRSIEIKELQNLESSVFIPLVGKQPAVTNPSSIQSSVQNTVQVILNTDLILPEYFAQILNQELGYQLRMNASIGSAQQSLNKELFLSSEFPLPTLIEQNKILELSRKLNDSIITLNTLHNQLWKKPSKNALIFNEYKKNFKEPTPDEWIEGLPFHLASILKGYYSKSEPSKKFEYLILFFEALSEFLANLFLSFYCSDKDFYKEHCEKLIGYDSQYKNWYLNSDFGGWNNLYSNLSKSTREFINNNEITDRVQSILGFPSQMFIENLTAKKISAILSIVCNLRNIWKGHSGITSDTLYKERVSTLENHLVSMKEFLINAFADCTLHVAGKMTYNDGTFIVDTKLLKGSHSIFKDERLNVSIPMEEGKQYILHIDQNKPILFLPLIKLLSSPQSEMNACYFYNRLEKNNHIRLISYHFDGKPEQNIEDPELVDALNLLTPEEKSKD
ncbi:MAG TPA: hypothetical protein VIL99_15050 [Ignavibacteria bacterium]